MAESLAGSDIETVVRACGSRLGYMAMKAKQIEAITAFVNGKDTFIVLPTGYGKSECQKKKSGLGCETNPCRQAPVLNNAQSFVKVLINSNIAMTTKIGLLM